MNETQRILAEMVGRLLADHVDTALLSAAEAGRWPAELWRLVEDQGLTQPLVPEAQGGMGASWHDAFVVVRAAGHARAPLPLPETMAAGWLLAQAGLEVPAGPLSLAEGAGLGLTRAGAGWTLSGVAARVPWGRVAGALVLMAADETGVPMMVRAPCTGAVMRPGTNLAGEFRDTLTFDRQPVEAAPPGPAVPADAVRVLGAMLRAAQMAGALADLLERTVTYANDRQQFGKPLGKQQAVQQNLAVLACEAAATGVAAEAAFLAADGGDPTFQVAAAKVRAGLAASQAVGIAHQVHGAIGFTLEHPLHWASRRLMAWRTEFGGDRQWSVALGRAVLARGADGFWPHLSTL